MKLVFIDRAGKCISYQRSFEKAATDRAVEEPEGGANTGNGISDLLVGGALVEIGENLLYQTVACIANDETSFFWFGFQFQRF